MRYIGIVLSIAFVVPPSVLAQSQELKHPVRLFLREEPASPAMRELQTLHRHFVRETVLYFPIETIQRVPSSRRAAAWTDVFARTRCVGACATREQGV